MAKNKKVEKKVVNKQQEKQLLQEEVLDVKLTVILLVELIFQI